MPGVQRIGGAMTFDPAGGVQRVELPFKPPVAVAEGMTVTFAVDGIPVYAEFLQAKMERHHGEWRVYAYVRPIPTGHVLTGFGEHSTHVRELEVIA
jgi:hypothetical protein